MVFIFWLYATGTQSISKFCSGIFHYQAHHFLKAITATLTTVKLGTK